MTGGNEAKHPVRIKATFARIRRPSKTDGAVSPPSREMRASPPPYPDAEPVPAWLAVRDRP